MLIEHHSGKLPDPLNYVRCLLQQGEGGLLISYAFYNTDISGSQYGRDVNCSNKDVSLSCKLWLFEYVRHSLVIVSSITLIAIHNRSSAYDSNNLQKSEHTVSPPVCSGPIPLSRVEFVRRTEIGQSPTSSLPRSGVVQSELPTRIQLGESSYTLV